MNVHIRTNPLSGHCIRSPDSNVDAFLGNLSFNFLSPLSQLGPDDYRDYAYTCLPEEMDVDVSQVSPLFDSFTSLM